MKNSKFKNLFTKETLEALKSSKTESEVKTNMSKAVTYIVDNLNKTSKKKTTVH